MKKFFLMALSVFLFSTTASFAGNDDNSNKVANEIDVLIEKAEPTYWEGYVQLSQYKQYYLRVYRTSGMCDSFVAHIYDDSRSDEKLGEAVVKVNPNYGSTKGGFVRQEHRGSQYYITFRGNNLYFNM